MKVLDLDPKRPGRESRSARGADLSRYRGARLQDAQRLLGPADVRLLEGASPYEREIWADALGRGQVLLLGAPVEQPRADPVVVGQLATGPLQPLGDRRPYGLVVSLVQGVDLDH